MPSCGLFFSSKRCPHNPVLRIMKKQALMALFGTLFIASSAMAQERMVSGKVTDEQGTPLASVAVRVRGTTNGTLSGNDGTYSIRATVGQILQFRLIGHTPEERTVGAGNVIDVQLKRAATNLDAVVVTTLGQTNVRRAIGSAQQTVQGIDIAQTQRQNFINALQGRVAGVEVTSSSGVPGASSSITIRGVSSISSSNQPLMIIDGLPLDNKTLNTGVLASDGRAQGKPVFQGFSLALQIPTEGEANRLFKALADGGQVQMPLTKTFFSPAFGMVADRFGVNWMVMVATKPS